MEHLLDEVSFDAVRLEGLTVTIDAAWRRWPPAP